MARHRHARVRNDVRKEARPGAQASPRADAWWKRASIKMIAVSACVALGAYETGLKRVVEPWMSEAFGWMEDRMMPMADDKDIGIDIRFWDPGAADARTTAEGLSITLGPKQCRQPDGYALTRRFAGRDVNAATHAFVHVTCRASGRVTVTLTPRSGATATIYDGRAKEWERLPFPGVKDSYSYGDVTVVLLDRRPPAGPWKPVNRCQATNSC